MNRTLWAAAALLLTLGRGAPAHNLDEYLQAAIVSIYADHVHVSMRLVPGVAVFPVVLKSIDTNSDGVLSAAEQQAYAARVREDLSLSVDGIRLQPRLDSVDFPTLDQMRQGVGEIRVELNAGITGGTARRRLILENHHLTRISAYLMNCLVPEDRNIQVLAQSRNVTQSLYQLDFRQSVGHPWSWLRGWQGLQISLGNLGGLPSLFRLGMRHIAAGTDHLLFLLALLLPAPLLARAGRWTGVASVPHSLRRILQVVTAFTAGHSITLALATLGVVSVPSRPIEILIAVSILISAVHALRPLFPGREAWIAGSFGLIHGLAFATTLQQLALSRWERIIGLVGFNLGIETMQLIVVAATLPSLLMLSRARSYSLVRIGGALFALIASVGWIAERSLQWQSPADSMVEGVAHLAPWGAALLLFTSLWSYVLRNWLKGPLQPRRGSHDTFTAEWALAADESGAPRYPRPPSTSGRT